MKISAVIIVKNEEKNIIDCIDSLQFCDEIIIVDDFSIDRTVELLKKFSKEKIKIYKRKLDNDFSAQRQFGIENTKNDWVFFLDGDERVSEELRMEISENLTESTSFGGFLIKRTDYLWGKELKYGETGNIRLLRIFNKKKGSLKGNVHEVWTTTSEVGYLVYPIKHFPHPTISEFLSEINFYTDLRSKELFNKHVKVGYMGIVCYPVGKFMQNYIFKLGFLDGIEGLVHASLMSFHSFLVRGKLWQMWQKS